MYIYFFIYIISYNDNYTDNIFCCEDFQQIKKRKVVYLSLYNLSKYRMQFYQFCFITSTLCNYLLYRRRVSYRKLSPLQY